jgi:hypothetical protein
MPTYRPHRTPGAHSEPEGRIIQCNNNVVAIRWTRSGPFCGRCHHPITDGQRALAEERLLAEFAFVVGVHAAETADDFDDSEDGLRAYAELLERDFPFLRLQTEQRRKALFLIASRLHRAQGFDKRRIDPGTGAPDPADTFPQRHAAASDVNTITGSLIADLLKEAQK